jgi:hypothetical protein
MQSLDWYVRRLRSMSPSEIAWRIRGGVRDVVDRPRFALGLYPPASRALPTTDRFEPGFRVSDVGVGGWVHSSRSDERRWCERLVDRADRIVKHRLSYFDLDEVDLGDPIDWNREHGAGVATPMRYAPLIDYRDFRVTGDCKLVWEPNRHHQLVVLGRAYRASGERRFADAVMEQLESWWAQCPFGYGMNWRSPLELGVRLINWVWATDLILESGLVTGDFRARLLHSAYLHLWEVARKFSRGSSANNHLIGEAAGVFVGASYFCHFHGATRWRDRAWALLGQELLEQTHPDGGGREQAISYQLFVLQFFVVAWLVAERTGVTVPPVYRQRLERMIDFVASLAAGGPLPMFGDADDGYVLDLQQAGRDLDGALCAGAILFQRPDWKGQVATYTESAAWLLGETGRARYDALPAAAAPVLRSRAFPETGLYLLQCGDAGSRDQVSLVVDCGDLGLGAIAAHGHADALSVTLRAFGRDVLVDPGTYDYFTFPEWRDYFRSTRAHNTVEIDGADQSQMLGRFIWGSRARARCVSWRPSSTGGRVVAEHDGYLRLPHPVLHRRSVELDGQKRLVVIQDELIGDGPHQMTIAFHLAEHCEVAEQTQHRFRISAGPGALMLALDQRLSVRVLRGSTEPRGGWVSRGYHRRTPATTILLVGEIRGRSSFTSHIEIEPGPHDQMHPPPREWAKGS